MSIIIPEIRALIPVDLSILSDELIQGYIGIVTEEADLALGNIFADPFSTVAEGDCQNYQTQNASGSNFISIGAWQDSNITIKKAQYDKEQEAVLTESALELGKDYTYWYGFSGRKIPGINLPVTAVKLSCPIGRYEFLRVYGTYGWQQGYPADVRQALVNVIISLAGYANSTAQYGGLSGITRVKDMTTEVEVGETMAQQLREQARSFLNDPVFFGIIQKYRYATNEGLSVI